MSCPHWPLPSMSPYCMAEEIKPGSVGMTSIFWPSSSQDQQCGLFRLLAFQLLIEARGIISARGSGLCSPGLCEVSGHGGVSGCVSAPLGWNTGGFYLCSTYCSDWQRAPQSSSVQPALCSHSSKVCGVNQRTAAHRDQINTQRVQLSSHTIIF